MRPIKTGRGKDTFHLILKLAKALRGFQDDSTFCENVTYTQFAILDFLSDANGVLPLSRLHELLEVEKSTTTRLVAPLLKMTLLEKKRTSNDGRAFELKLTPKGRRTHEVVWTCLSEHLNRMIGHIPAEDSATVMRSLYLFAKALNKCCKD